MLQTFNIFLHKVYHLLKDSKWSIWYQFSCINSRIKDEIINLNLDIFPNSITCWLLSTSGMIELLTVIIVIDISKERKKKKTNWYHFLCCFYYKTLKTQPITLTDSLVSWGEKHTGIYHFRFQQQQQRVRKKENVF